MKKCTASRVSELAFFLVTCCASSLGSTICFTGDLRAGANVTSCGLSCTLGATNSDGGYAQYAAVVKSFTVGVTSAMIAVSFSYGGGVNSAAKTIAQGRLEPGRNIFVFSGSNDGLNPRVLFTVPAGKRYVIEQYSGGCNVDTTTYGTDVELVTTAAGGTHRAHVVAHFQQPDGSYNGHAVNFYVGTGLGPAYADAGSTIYVQMNTASTGFTTGVEICEFSVSGHVINNP